MRERYVTKGVREKVDNIMQVMLWKDYVTPSKLKDGDMIAFKLKTCEYSSKQMVYARGNHAGEAENLYNVPNACDEDVAVVYIEDENKEVMMLASESEVVAERFKAMY